MSATFHEQHAQYFEYTSSANPLAAGLLPRIPGLTFPASLHKDGPTKSTPLDLSESLACSGPATSPGLLASFLRILEGDSLTLSSCASSMIFYVMQGSGTLRQGSTQMPFHEGDFLAIPSGEAPVLSAHTTARLYQVDDTPLLRYLGVHPSAPRFIATRYPAAKVQEQLQSILNDPRAPHRNRISVLLGNDAFPQTRTITHTLWAMYGVVTPHSAQKPHRHQSVALDFVAKCAPGCYSLVGVAVDASGAILNPTRVDWDEGLAFVTPPGYWHAHFNTSNEDAYIIPIQDAGLHTYLRTLDIRFT